ncbi:MAG: alpha/beta hydrolase [Clostridia bacterium]|nr:alpha/beta hydrolase [Clostridia bacterium]
MKYPIAPEFFPYSMFIPPLNKLTLPSSNLILRHAPCFSDEALVVRRFCIPYTKGNDVLYMRVLSPHGAGIDTPCLLYFHGGGFMLRASWHHARLVREYAKRVGCHVALPEYRLAPAHPWPAAEEDAMLAFDWLKEQGCASIAVGGDSAGGWLSAVVAQQCRQVRELRFQMLIYPVVDRHADNDSMRRFTDTPMWNSRLHELMWRYFIPETSPMEAESFAGLAPAYIETAEFDCLHDEGVAYADALRAAGVPVELHETAATMHGYDIVDTPITQASMTRRVEALQRALFI